MPVKELSEEAAVPESATSMELDQLVSNESKDAEENSEEPVGNPSEDKAPDLSNKEGEDAPVATIEDVRKQMDPEILTVLSEKFNGKLTKVRRVDSKDMLF